MDEKLRQARDLAKKLYEDHNRLSGETLLAHSVKVKDLLIGIGVEKVEVLIAAVLHHVPRLNNKKFIMMVENQFGNYVVDLLNELERISNLRADINTPSQLNKELIVQYYLNLAKNPDALLVFLADKTEGSKTFHVLSKEGRKRSAERSLYIYRPICNLVGLHGFAQEIEKNAFRVLHPREFYKISKNLRKKKAYTYTLLKNLKQLLSNHFQDRGLNPIISYRIKSEFSIYDKLQKYKRRGVKKDYSNLKDIAAMRIIVGTVEECYLVEDILREIWEYDETARNDYITNPTPSGYKSLHNDFLIDKDFYMEIQIRTKKMHEDNEYGKAAHVFYKHGDSLKRYLSKDMELLKSLDYQQAEYSQDTEKPLGDYVYALTPEGDIKELPAGATVLDFAYEIHREIGNKCMGAIVNGEIKKLSYKLKDGDKVEIKISNFKDNVNLDWLDYVVTRRARREIRRALRKRNM